MQACLFDIDGTLLSTGGAGKAALEAALASAFGIPRLMAKLELSGRTDRAIVRDLFCLHEIEESPESLHRLLDAYLRHLPDCLARIQGHVLPGITGFLEHLGSRGDVAIGLLTGNIRAGAQLKLEHYALMRHFAFGGFGDHHHDRDDVAREALTEVHRLHNGRITPERIWVIGDTPHDVRCARCIGARAVAVATGWHSLDELTACCPDLALKDLSDPGPLMALLD